MTLAGEPTSGQLQGAEIHWAGESAWIRMTSEQALGSLSGFWTEKSDPGKQVYVIRGNQVQGGGLDSNIIVNARGALSMACSENKTSTGVVKVSEIQWEAPVGEWIRLPFEHAADTLNGVWTEKKHPGDKTYVVSGGNLHGSGLESSAITIGNSGAIAAQIGAEPAMGKLLDGEITWGGDMGTWVRLSSQDVLASMAGIWMVHPGEQTVTVKESGGGEERLHRRLSDLVEGHKNIYLVDKYGKVFDDMMEENFNLSMGLTVSSIGLVNLTISGASEMIGQLLGDEVNWKGEGGSWLRINVNQLLEGYWKSATKGNVYSIGDGKIFSTGHEPRDMTMTGEGIIVATRMEGKSEGMPDDMGQMKGGHIHWLEGSTGGDGDFWERLSGEDVLKTLSGLWTEKSDPGTRVFTIRDGILQGGGLKAAAVTVAKNGMISTTYSGKLAQGRLEGSELQWSRDAGEWIPWDESDKFNVLNGYWKCKQENNATAYYFISAGEVSGPSISSDGSAVPLSMYDGKDSEGTSTLKVQAPIGDNSIFATAILENGELSWKGFGCSGADDEGTWERHAIVQMPDLKAPRTIAVMRPIADTAACAQNDITWLPLDMPGHPMTIADNTSHCMQRCALTEECAHYTFWPAGGFCHVQDTFSKIVFNAFGYLSGPPDCAQKGGTNVNTSVIVLQGEKCWEDQTTYFSASPVTYGEAALPAIAGSARLCMERCQTFKWCRVWTYDIIGQLCYMNTDTNMQEPMMNHIAGPRTCRKQYLFFDMEIHGVNATMILENHDMKKKFRAAAQYGITHFREIIKKTNNSNLVFVSVSTEVDSANESSSNESSSNEPYENDRVMLSALPDANGILTKIKLASIEDMPMQKLQKVLTNHKDALGFAVLWSIQEYFLKGGDTDASALTFISAENQEVVLRGKDKNGKPECTSSPLAWTDSQGDACENYANSKMCTQDGLPGEGWDASWGRFDDYESQGRTADQACCECGGGSTNDFYPHADDEASRRDELLNDTLAQVAAMALVDPPAPYAAPAEPLVPVDSLSFVEDDTTEVHDTSEPLAPEEKFDSRSNVEAFGIASRMSGFIFFIGGTVLAAALTPVGRRFVRQGSQTAGCSSPASSRHFRRTVVVDVEEGGSAPLLFDSERLQFISEDIIMRHAEDPVEL